MANDHIDGFGHYGADAAGAANMLKGVYQENGAWQPKTSNPRTGTYGLRDTSGGGNGASVLRRIFVTAGTKKFMGAAFYHSSIIGNNVTYAFWMAKNVSNVAICTLTLASTGALMIRQGDNNGTIVATSDPGVFLPGIYQHVEFMVDTAGQSAEARVNGVTVCNASGLALSGGPISQWSSGKHQSGGVGITIDMADLRAGDAGGGVNNDFMGDRRVFTRFPNADGSPQTWTPSTGATAWACIDEAAPNDDTDYIGATAVGKKARVSYPALPAGVALISGLAFATYAEKTDVGDATIKVNAVSGATDSPGTEHALSQAYGYMPLQCFDQDPNVSAPWTVTTANAMLSEIERTL